MLYCTTITVDIQGSEDFINIQDGIDISQHGDTVLVYPGTYVENLDFNGKSIVLASLELMTGDASYIDSTIIDGGQQSSCIRLHNSEQDAVIQGFSITNGIGYDHVNSGAGRPGGGIAINTPYGEPQTFCKINNCKIFKNKATTGAGIYCYKSSFFISGTKITENYGTSGGGLSILNQSSVIFDSINRCNIYNNFAGTGSDILCYNTGDIEVLVDTFTVFDPMGYFAEYLDEGAYAGNVTFDIQHKCLEEVNHDLYVAIDGSDSNSGLTINDPLKTIAWALHIIESDSVNPKTVYVAEGTYSYALNGQIFPLGFKANTSLIGEDATNTILLNDEFMCTVSSKFNKGICKLSNITLISSNNLLEKVLLFAYFDELKLENLILFNNFISENSITTFYQNNDVFYENLTFLNNIAEKTAGLNHEKGNAYIKDCYFENNHSFGLADQSYSNVIVRICAYDTISVENSIFINNSNMSYEEAPFCFSNKQFYSPDVYIKNCLFAGNETPCSTVLVASPGDLPTPDSLDVQITNCTFADNKSSLSTLSFMGAIDITNTILYDSTDYEIYLDDWSYHNMYATLNIKNCDIKNGQNGILNMHPYNTINWLEGNIDQNPLFAGGDPFSYELTWNSPCIDAGTGDTTGLHLPQTDLAGNPRITGGRIDIGAYEWLEVSTGEEIYGNNDIISFYASPNPFKSGTMITCSIKEVLENDTYELSIYNVRGQLIKQFNREHYDLSPYSEIYWDGTDLLGKQVAPGTYLYKLEYNGNAVVRKMVRLR